MHSSLVAHVRPEDVILLVAQRWAKARITVPFSPAASADCHRARFAPAMGKPGRCILKVMARARRAQFNRAHILGHAQSSDEGPVATLSTTSVL
jgi:hypothetical protein